MAHGIVWPAELVKGNEEAWRVFAANRRIAYGAVRAMVHGGILRFTEIVGLRCFVITDTANIAAEIRRIDGRLFGNGEKQYHLTGVKKAWLPPVENSFRRFYDPEIRFGETLAHQREGLGAAEVVVTCWALTPDLSRRTAWRRISS